MKSILDYPTQRLTTLINCDPMVAQTHAAYNKIRCDESVLVEQLIIDQSRLIQRLKDEILTLHTCNTAVAHVTKFSNIRMKKFPK